MEDLERLKSLGYELGENERLMLPEDISGSKEKEEKHEPKFEEMRLKLKEIEYKPLKKLSRFPWIESLCINDVEDVESNIDINQDKRREEYFYKIASRCTALGLNKLKAMDIKFSRPSDYYAEMLKSDKQMGKIRSKLASKLNLNRSNKSKNIKTKKNESKKSRGKHAVEDKKNTRSKDNRRRYKLKDDKTKNKKSKAKGDSKGDKKSFSAKKPVKTIKPKKKSLRKTKKTKN